ncbi:MAG: hypothetical protein ACLR23_02680 [Clostridia bacterium]
MLHQKRGHRPYRAAIIQYGEAAEIRITSRTSLHRLDVQKSLQPHFDVGGI